jgi:hypothetical protein
MKIHVSVEEAFKAFGDIPLSNLLAIGIILLGVAVILIVWKQSK